jgi:hypothetical protein
MTASISTRFPPLPPETLRAKAAHLTAAGCFLAIGALFLVSSWDEVNCVAGEITSSGPCGIALIFGASLITVGIGLLIVGCIMLVRGLRRPVDPEGGDGWRSGQAFVVMACGALLGLLIPRYECPPGMNLSPVFHFCVSPNLMYPAPSPGLPWKFAVVGIGIALGIVMLRWRSMPWWLGSAILVVVSIGTALVTVSRATGIPGLNHYTPPPAIVGAAIVVPGLVPARLRPVARRGARRLRRS